MPGTMTLKEAVERWKATPGTPSNAYTWYQMLARTRGKVHLGERDVQVRKVGRSWVLNSDDFEGALQLHGVSQGRRAEVDARIARHEFTGKPGDYFDGLDGGYRIEGEFAFAWNHLQIIRRKSDGSWYCRDCGTFVGYEQPGQAHCKSSA